MTVSVSERSLGKVYRMDWSGGGAKARPESRSLLRSLLRRPRQETMGVCVRSVHEVRFHGWIPSVW